MAITKPPVLPAWADAGDKVQPSNAELSVGWPVSSTPPSRQRFNWVLNYVANAVRYFSRRGLVDYDAAETYMTGDRIIGDDGKTYRSLIDNNTAQTPSTSPTKWERWGFSQSDLGANSQTQPYTAFTTTGATGAFVLTPTPAIAAYAANQRFRVKFHAVGNGSDTLAVSGLAAKSLKQYDSTGAKVAPVLAANQLVDVEYDGIDFVLLDPLPVALVTGLQAGEVAFFARNTAPTGYLKANGSAVSRTTYATLFAAIGTTFGVGDGSTTFNIPDLRGEFLRGWDDARGVDSGRAFGTLQTDAMQGHQHTHYWLAGSNGTTSGGSGMNPGSSNTSSPVTDGTNGTPRTAAETRPRNVAMLACIKF
jgi:microcystin-dependent protein